MTLALPQDLADRILAEAQASHPWECCGLIEGEKQAGEFQAHALHPCRNLSTAPDRFQIDPADHLRAARHARGHRRCLIGCYHSHPDGQCKPSSHDLAGAGEENFIWLIAAGGGLAGFIYSAGRFADLGLITGADLVTSSL